MMMLILRMRPLIQCIAMLVICQGITLRVNCPVLLGGKYCMQLSPAGQQHEALEYCYKLWDHADLTVWQLHEHNPELFTELRLKLLELRVHQVWLEAEAQYKGGLFLYTYPGNLLFNTPVTDLNFSSTHMSHKQCLTWEVPTMNHHPRACMPTLPRRYFPAICLTLQAPTRFETFGCPPRFNIAPRIIGKCGFAQKSGHFESWSEAVQVCKAAHKDTDVIQLGYTALVRIRIGNCSVGFRKIVNSFNAIQYIWDPMYQDLDEVQGGTSEILSTNLSHSLFTGAVITRSSPTLVLVDDNFTINCVICKTPVPTDIEPTLTLTARSKNGYLQILLEVKNGFLLLAERSQNSDVAGSVKLSCFTDSISFFPHRVDVTKSSGSRYSLRWRGDGYYWCYGQDVFTLQSVASNTVLARGDDTLQTWVVPMQANLSMLGRHVFLPPINTSDADNYDSLDSDWIWLLGHHLTHNVTEIKLKRLYRDGTKFLLHVIQQKESRGILSSKFEFGGVRYGVIYVHDVDWCPLHQTLLNNVFLEWPETKIGDSVAQEKDCVRYTRTCKGNFNEGANWSKITEHISAWTIYCSKRMHSIVQNSRMVDDSDLTSSSDDSSTVHRVHPEILRAVSSLQELSGVCVNKTMLLSAIDSFDEVLNYDLSEVVNARSTGSDLMQNMDNILRNAEIQEEFLKIVKPNTAVFISGKSSESHIAGISLSTPQETKEKNFKNSQLNILKYDQLRSLLLENSTIDVAVVISKSVSKLKPRMSVIILANSSLLVSASKWDMDNVVLNSKVVGVVMKGVKGKHRLFEGFENFVEIIFKPENVEGKKVCAYWDFDTWSWNTQGCEINSSRMGLDICHCRHVTYFAELIIQNGHAIGHTDQVALDVISITGCALSLMGLLGICTTSIKFPSWRHKLSNQLLLSLSAAVGLKMVLFLVVGMGGATRGAWCVVVGAGLHYALLASLCWMLLVAWLQYKRLVGVFGRPYPSHLLLKGSLFCWSVPSVPVSILLIIDPGLYTVRAASGARRNFCYPDGIPFYVAVVLPVTVITSFNVLVFCVIMMNISNCVNKVKTKAYSSPSRKAHLYRALTGLLLFFLLGTTWVFGLLAQVTLFAYIFCITATLQGAILFFFFIVGSQRTRARWSISMPKRRIRKKRKTTSVTTQTTNTSRCQQSDVPKTQEIYLQNNNFE